MNRPKIDELELKEHLQKAEQNLGDSVLRGLAEARANAVAQKNLWGKEYFEQFTKGYRGVFSASLITASLAAVLLLPNGGQWLTDPESSLILEDSVTLMMEDPEFYLWLNETGMLVAER